ncbi:MAG: glutaredoxin [Gammaproteobacteria bacterium]|jgi:glutaredoxin 2|nr:glutaredoxin [Gammaproteobacteria bacterium]|tara:strand:- start:1089 stop:1382 length:294 start_codon:yes stop_codon:yes gene_type:complete
MPERHVLYQYDACPFCRRVRQFVAQAGIDLETRDTLRDPEARRELVEGGGRSMVPCLRIERDGDVQWLYESLDIIDYLRRYHEAAGDGRANARINHP